MATKENHPEPQSVTPEQAAGQIRFALSELSSENAHHEFEHLCRFLTRERICSNIIPSTGPVSSGGDQGVDFETYPISPSLAGSPFFALATAEKWIFACSLEKNFKKKIKSDLAAAAVLNPKPTKLYFFHHLPIATAARHKLQAYARETFGIGLEVMDCKAISELLSNPDTVWIAESYLRIPSAFILVRRESEERWYEYLLSEDDHALTDGSFFRLKDAIREVAYIPKLRSDAPKLFAKIRLYRNYASDRIRRKAIYEEFVASLRGLRDCVGYEADLRTYLTDLETLTDPADVEDGAVIVSYILGARMQEGLQIPLSEVGKWHTQLTKRVEYLLSTTDHIPRKCALLISKASLQFSQGLLVASDQDDERQEQLRIAAGNGVNTWIEIITLSKQAPLFPVERIGNFADAIAVFLDTIPENGKLQKELEHTLSLRSGKQSVIKRRLKRAHSFQSEGKKLRALEELHQAQIDAISAHDAVLLTLSLARLYSGLDLHFAAKHYALSSAFAALRLPDEDLRSLAYRGCAEAAASDYASGGSLMSFLTAEAFMLLTHHYSMGGTDERRQFEWARIDFHLIQITYWSKLISTNLQTELINRLDLWDSKDIYDETLPRAEQMYSQIKTLEDLSAKTTENNICPFFSDSGRKRRVTWTQLQIRWEVTWPNKYETARFAESFCAYLQIIFAELTDLELSILPGRAKVEIQMSTKDRFQFEELPDNHAVSRILHIPSQAKSYDEETNLAVSAVFMFLDTFSADEQDALVERLRERISERMPRIFSAYASNSQLFQEFYLEEDYETLYQIVEQLDSMNELPTLKGDPELFGPTGIHPTYIPQEFHVQIERRYRRIPPTIKFTLMRLKSEPIFLATVDTLRAEGWKDWHFLLAIANIRMNALYGYRGNREPDDIWKKRFKEKFEAPELESDPIVPSDEFTLTKLKKALQLARLTTLTSWGFQIVSALQTSTPLMHCLGDFNYWTDDVDHQQLF